MIYDGSLAEIYDLIYALGGMKDYAAEANAIAGLIRDRRPAASSLLDVACGTGLHLQTFAGLFGHVEGVDLSPDMATIAADRNSGITIHTGDMRTLHLGRTFSAVTCLFSSIGYMQTESELRQALQAFAAHTEPGGVVLVEPWFTRQQWDDGKVGLHVAQNTGRHLVRMSYPRTPDPEHSLMQMRYLYGVDGAGIRDWTDEHLMSLFTSDQYEQAFTTAGLANVQWIRGSSERSRERIIGFQA